MRMNLRPHLGAPKFKSSAQQLVRSWSPLAPVPRGEGLGVRGTEVELRNRLEYRISAQRSQLFTETLAQYRLDFVAHFQRLEFNPLSRKSQN